MYSESDKTDNTINNNYQIGSLMWEWHNSSDENKKKIFEILAIFGDQGINAILNLINSWHISEDIKSYGLNVIKNVKCSLKK